MSILIKGIDMPKDGKRTFWIYPDGDVVVMDTAWTQVLSLKGAAEEWESGEYNEEGKEAKK